MTAISYAVHICPYESVLRYIFNVSVVQFSPLPGPDEYIRF